MSSGWRRAGLGAVLCVVAMSAVSAGAQERAARPLVVTALDSGGAALVHAVVEVRAVGARAPVARGLTDAAGRVRLVVEAERAELHVVVRRLGYRPVRLPVPADGAATVRLDRVPQRLASMTVRVGPSRCQPGYVPHDADSTVALLVDAVATHAAQHATFAALHPWRASWRYTGREHDPSGAVVRTVAADLGTVDVRADTLGYAPGRLIERRGLGHVKARWEQLRDLALPAFLAHHCFRTGEAPDTALGRPAIALAFRADRTVRTPDVDGVVLLDAATHEPLKLVLDWVHLPMGFRASQEVVRFCPIAPGVVVPVARRFWQTYTQARYWHDVPITWSSAERVLTTLAWAEAPPSGIASPFLARACPGAEDTSEPGATAR